MTTTDVVIFGVMAVLVAGPPTLAHVLVACFAVEPERFVTGFWAVTLAASFWGLLVIGYPWFGAEWVRTSRGEAPSSGLDPSWRTYFVGWLLFVVLTTSLSWVVARYLRRVRGLDGVRKAPPSTRRASRICWLAYLAVFAFLLQRLVV